MTMMGFSVLHGKYVTLLFVCILASLFSANSAYSVPLSFLLDPTTNLRNVEWYRLESPRFTIYASKSSEKLARYGLRALETAYPDIGLLLGVHLDGQPELRPNGANVRSLFSRVPVIVSTGVNVGGFANPVTQNIELKISAGSSASLFQHELVHRLMYDHMDPWLGPGGRVFTLAMTPAWWLEGLAEFLTESVGQTQTAALARSMALNASFLDWDRLHSLYQIDSTDLFLRGYVTSGRFFRYLMKQQKQDDLYSVHRELFKFSLIPPFVSAQDFLFFSQFGKLGSAVYEDFKAAEIEKWEKKSADLPSLKKLSRNHSTTLFYSESSPYINMLGEGFLSVGLRTETYPGALVYRPSESESGVRIASDAPGSSLARVLELEEDAVMWTASLDRDEFGRRTSDLYVYRLPLPEQSDRAQLEWPGQKGQVWEVPLWRVEISRLYPGQQVQDIFVLDEKQAFVLMNDEGRKHLVLVSADSGQTRVVQSYDVPMQITVLPAPWRAARHCVSLLVNADQHVTSIERLCLTTDDTDPQVYVKEAVVLPPRGFNVLSATETHDQQYLLVVSWGEEFVGLIIWNPETKRANVVSVLSDWIVDPQPGHSEGEYYVWVHHGSGFAFVPLPLEELAQSYSAALSLEKLDPMFAALPPWKAYDPPFRVMADRARKGLPLFTEEDSSGRKMSRREISSALVQGEGWMSGTVANAPASVKEEGRSIASVVSWERADVRSGHWFTYPQARPSFFGGPSLGLVSVPLRDEMERYQILTLAEYNFETEKANVTLTYASRRLFEGFRIDAFSRERFNGLYHLFVCPEQSELFICVNSDSGPAGSKRFHYLRENGISTAATFSFRPRSPSLTVTAGFAQLTPSIGARSAVLGPQFVPLATLGVGLTSEIYQAAFYMAPERSTSGKHLLLSASASLLVEENVSVGMMRDGRGTHLEDEELHFQDVTASASQLFSYDVNRLTLRGSIARTFGKNTLNRRQVFTPYRTYLLGSGSSLNKLNIPLYRSGSLFSYWAGDWQYRMTADFVRPLLADIDWRLTILFVESIDMEIVLGRGGVAQGNGFHKPTSIDSASAALRLNMDVKGFKIFPSLAYGQVFGEPTGSLFAELSFSDFF